MCLETDASWSLREKKKITKFNIDLNTLGIGEDKWRGMWARVTPTQTQNISNLEMSFLDIFLWLRKMNLANHGRFQPKTIINNSTRISKNEK